MKISSGVATDVGLVREGNEDSYLVQGPLFAVADGMGGHRGGEVASRIAIETIEGRFRRSEGVLPEQVQEANRAVFERSMLDRSVAGMGTTLTAALIEGDRARLAHVGDSRAYLFRDGELRLLTEDHTLVHRLVQQGEITPAEAERHPQRSVVTRVLGVEMSVSVDEVVLDLRPGDRLLLCSDGLTGMVDDAGIAAVLSREPDPQRAAEALVTAANEAGGVDNTTAIVVAVEDGDGTWGSAGGGRRRDTLVGPPSRAPSRPSPGRARRPRWARIVVVVAAVAAVLVLGSIGLRAYLDSQWYVGVANGHVSIYQGIPVEVAGFELHHVVVETPIQAGDAQAAARAWAQLPAGITAEDRTDAEQIVEQIRSDVAAAEREPKPAGNP